TLVDRPRVWGRRELADKALDPAIALLESADGRRSDAEGRSGDDSIDVLGLAAGMDQLAIAVGEAPHRRKVRVADRLVPGKSGQEIFRQIERIVAPGSARRLAVHTAHLSRPEAHGGTGLA